MLEQGWAEEVQRLIADDPTECPGMELDRLRSRAGFLHGTLARAAFHEKVLIDTRQYAKRQRTWFRHQLPDDVTTRSTLDADSCGLRCARGCRGRERVRA